MSNLDRDSKHDLGGGHEIEMEMTKKLDAQHCASMDAISKAQQGLDRDAGLWSEWQSSEFLRPSNVPFRMPIVHDGRVFSCHGWLPGTRGFLA